MSQPIHNSTQLHRAVPPGHNLIPRILELIYLFLRVLHRHIITLIVLYPAALQPPLPTPFLAPITVTFLPLYAALLLLLLLLSLLLLVLLILVCWWGVLRGRRGGGGALGGLCVGLFRGLLMLLSGVGQDTGGIR